jgi:membrane protein implicated in regulation of membrane protease activity
VVGSEIVNVILVILFLIIGAVFIFLELNSPTNFELFAIGLGFFTLALLTYLRVNFLIQVLVFVLVVSLTIFLVRKFSMRRMEGSKDFTPISVVGKEGRVVLVEGDKVVVRVEGEDWLAESEDELKVGDKVVVLEILGNKLRVKRR